MSVNNEALALVHSFLRDLLTIIKQEFCGLCEANSVGLYNRGLQPKSQGLCSLTVSSNLQYTHVSWTETLQQLSTTTISVFKMCFVFIVKQILKRLLHK